MATTSSLLEGRGVNYKPPSCSQKTISSFHELAELARLQETTTGANAAQMNPSESYLNKDVFREPQIRPERFLSYDDDDDKEEEEEEDENVNRSMEALRMLKDECEEEDEDGQFGGIVCTDMKPSLFNFKGFLETLSLDLHLKYAMDHPRRGLALIFNHDTFDPRLGLAGRSGSNADVKQLKKQFAKMGFEVYVYANLGLIELKKAVKLASSVDHGDADSFVCVFLTHGDDEGLIYANDGSINLRELLDQFRGNKCPSLIGKPKIFIIQACRGRELEVGVCETDGGIEDTDAKSLTGVADAMADAGTRTTVPAGADFVVCHSVVEGYFSFRDTVSGSWYIQALCQALASYGTTLDFTLLLTLVNRMVAEKCVKRSADPRMLGRKQMPCFVSMLTKQLVFTPKRRNRVQDIKK